MKHLIAVASGKGGVGKSTTAANLALALATGGARVGILDADLYGPSQPRMLGLKGMPDSLDGKVLEPMIGHGIQTMSIGFLVDDESPIIWRGPMITQALTRLMYETHWNNLDYLIVDMPPGTGDIHLTMAQRMPVSGAVIVTTPQDIALLDARKGLSMFEKVAKESGTELLGELPLDIRIRTGSDSGRPIVVSDPGGPLATAYGVIAERISRKIKLVASPVGDGETNEPAMPRIFVE